MPYITKHLMFGTAGKSGEEVHTTITLSEGSTLSIVPGKGAAKTEYKSGKNGGNGADSTVTSEGDNNVSYTAHGGQGGTGSQKTDEYLLCHVSDLQSTDSNKPCYYKDDKDNDFKKTHYIKDGVFKGIQAIKYNVAPSVNAFMGHISKELKSANPGMGAMGFGTESVSDFICETRHLDKDDDYPISNVIKQPSSLSSVKKYCHGNSKIKYILPNQAYYSPSTGAVIIWW